jgi:hypothetical protein
MSIHVNGFHYILNLKSKVKGKIEFDLKRYSDFSIKCSDSKRLEIIDKTYYVSMQPDQSVDLELIFSPTEVRKKIKGSFSSC